MTWIATAPRVPILHAAGGARRERQRAIDRAAAREEARTVDDVRGGLDGAADAADEGEIAGAAAAGDADRGTAAAVVGMAALGAVLLRALRRTVARGVGSAAGDAALVAVPGGALERAAAWAGEHAGTLISGLTDETRAAVRQVLAEQIRAGEIPATTARRIRSIVGLTRRQAGAVENLRRGRVAAGAEVAVADAAAARYAGELRAQRAVLIARTETTAAMSAGRRALWDERIAAAEVGADDFVRVWLTALDERVDETCRTIVATGGKAAGLTAPFVTGAGTFQDPPAHPGCRCTVLVEPI